jgi:hypothetical protein
MGSHIVRFYLALLESDHFQPPNTLHAAKNWHENRRPCASAAVFNLLPYMCVKGRDELLALHQEKLLPEFRQ